MCVANLRYRRPLGEGGKKMKALLGYLTYRDSRHEGAKLVAGKERWVDRGMGKSVQQIAERCKAYQSDHVLLFSLVINPNPTLVVMIPHDQREAFVRQLTEGVVEDFFVERGIDTGVEFSYVYHSRNTDADGRHNPHTHIVLPGTFYEADEGRRVPLYFSQNRSERHIDLLHTVTERHTEQLLERYIGRDWERLHDERHPATESDLEPTIGFSLDI
jgi:hypothetical protein